MEKVTMDYSKLRGKIIEKCGSQKAFAELLGVTNTTLTLKINSKRYFTQQEILKSANILGISPEHISMYFFTKKVQ